MGNASSNKYDENPSQESEQQNQSDKKSPAKQAEPDKTKKPIAPESSGGGWFGGIFKNFGKPKNQMKLPDDKNPAVRDQKCSIF